VGVGSGVSARAGRSVSPSRRNVARLAGAPDLLPSALGFVRPREQTRRSRRLGRRL